MITTTFFYKKKNNGEHEVFPTFDLIKINTICLSAFIFFKLNHVLFFPLHGGAHLGVVVITTAQIHSAKPELRFCAGSNPAWGMSEIRDGEDLRQLCWLEIRQWSCLLSVNHTTKTIRYHHHHHHHHHFFLLFLKQDSHSMILNLDWNK